MKNIPWNYLCFIFLFVLVIGCKSKKKVADITTPQSTATTPEATEKTPDETSAESEEVEETVARELTTEDKLTEYFSAISNAPSTASANKSIDEALNMFASPEALVLIIIGEYDGEKDYDRPTTIREYLNYLKDQKKKFDKIDTMKKDASGKITELELRK